ncbi:MAG: hypothetical protein MUO23_12560 [Anaerolineales bacterium]|nr:hypothetical protein [Anaerolineales bacterium]
MTIGIGAFTEQEAREAAMPDRGAALHQAEARLRGRLQRLHEGLRAKFDGEGRPIDERAVRAYLGQMEKSATQALDTYRDEINKAADPFIRGLSEAEATLAEAKQADIFTLLGPTDAVRASALRDFASDTAGRLSPKDLATRLRGIARTGDRPAAAVYLTYGTRRLEAERERAARAGGILPDDGLIALETALAGLEPIALGEAEVKRRTGLENTVRVNTQSLETISAALRRWDLRDIRDRFGLTRRSLWQELFTLADITAWVEVPDPPGSHSR